jgi:hypothetical protein
MTFLAPTTLPSFSQKKSVPRPSSPPAYLCEQFVAQSANASIPAFFAARPRSRRELALGMTTDWIRIRYCKYPSTTISAVATNIRPRPYPRVEIYIHARAHRISDGFQISVGYDRHNHLFNNSIA